MLPKAGLACNHGGETQNAREKGKGRRLRLYLFSFVLLSLAATAQTGPDDRVVRLLRTYSTPFPRAENPISDAGNWISGETAGMDWANVHTTPGFAFGTESGKVKDGTYKDGSPGMGFYIQGATRGNDDYGFTSFEASD